MAKITAILWMHCSLFMHTAEKASKARKVSDGYEQIVSEKKTTGAIILFEQRKCVRF